MFFEGLFNFLGTSPVIVAQLGATRGDKTKGVFPMLANPQPTFPYIVTEEISSDNATSMQGTNRFTTTRMRLSCYGSTYGQAKKLAEAVRQAFGTVSNYQGALSDGTILQSALQVPPGEVDDAEPQPHGMLYSSHLDYEFEYTNQS